MYRTKTLHTNVLLSILALSCLSRSAIADRTNTLKQSLVYIETSTYSYSALYPWRHTDLSKRVGYGCAVGPYRILTTAFNVADASF
ncbi:MAG: hypothetical protein KAJ46_02440, partial [Sedimentisphaerales bacterium]|nr:hypothetical protein [Sedimentisphaerales bacterium]